MLAHGLRQRPGVHPCCPCRRPTGSTEAQAEQEPVQWAQVYEVALVVVAVLQRVEMQRLDDHLVDFVAGDVACQGDGVADDLGVCRAHGVDHGVLEDVGDRDIGMRMAQVVVVPDRQPRTQAHRAARSLDPQPIQKVSGQPGRRGPRAKPAVASRLGREGREAALDEPHSTTWIVGENVSCRVVEGGEGQSADARLVADAIEGHVVALVHDVAREREH